MKNLTTILTELGIEVPEEKKSELEKQLGENYKPVSEVEKVRAARDNYKAQLDTAQEFNPHTPDGATTAEALAFICKFIIILQITIVNIISRYYHCSHS